MTDLRKLHWNEIRDTLTGKRAIVHDAMLTSAPCTACELADNLRWDKTSVRPRFTELFHAGLIETTGERRNGEYIFNYVALVTAEKRARELSESLTRGVSPAQQLSLFV